MKEGTVIIGLALILVVAGLFGLMTGHAPAAAEAGAGQQAAQAAAQAAVGTGFTYQGQLRDDSGPVNGSCDFTFELWDAGTGGNQVGAVNKSGVTVADGLFTVQLDFGAGAFGGDARWLATTVDCGDGAQALSPRQRLRPAPYARFAPAAGSAPWSGLTGVPGDIADGDDDTTYSAGSGLNLSGTTFSADTGSVQARVGEACAVGSTIRAVNADGSVECVPDAPLNRNRPPAGTVTTTVDSEGWAGSDTAVTIGADGLPVIAEHVSTGGNDLRVAHCEDIACTTATVTTVDSAGDVGDGLAITLGTDGLPLISYYDASNGDLKVAHCDDVACTGATITTLDSSGNVGRRTSIMIGADGLGLIGYYDEGNGDLKVAHCADVACTAASHATTIDAGSDVGQYSSVALGADGRGLIAYYDAFNGNLKMAHCDDVACTSAATTIVASTGDVGQYPAVAIGADGVGIIAYWDSANEQLMAGHCDDLSCASVTSSTLAATGNATNDAISIAVGADNLPIISYNDDTVDALMVAHCTDRLCRSATTVAVDDSSANTGLNTSITIGTDGLPFISYFDRSNLQLMGAHCSNSFCLPNFRRR